MATHGRPRGFLAGTGGAFSGRRVGTKRCDVLLRGAAVRADGAARDRLYGLQAVASTITCSEAGAAGTRRGTHGRGTQSLRDLRGKQATRDTCRASAATPAQRRLVREEGSCGGAGAAGRDRAGIFDIVRQRARGAGAAVTLRAGGREAKSEARDCTAGERCGPTDDDGGEK